VYASRARSGSGRKIFKQRLDSGKRRCSVGVEGVSGRGAVPGFKAVLRLESESIVYIVSERVSA
jgi:hypothetical protein